jgi:hypothetical protein
MKLDEVSNELNLNPEYNSILTSDNESLMTWLYGYSKVAPAMTEIQKTAIKQLLKGMLNRQLEATSL